MVVDGAVAPALQARVRRAWAPKSAMEPTAATINPADTVFLMISYPLVLLMTPALALYYGGLVHA